MDILMMMCVARFFGERYYEYVRADERGIWTRGIFSDRLIAWNEIHKIDVAKSSSDRVPALLIYSTSSFVIRVYSTLGVEEVEASISTYLPVGVPLAVVEDIGKIAWTLSLAGYITIGLIVLPMLLAFVYWYVYS